MSIRTKQGRDETEYTSIVLNYENTSHIFNVLFMLF